MNIEKPSLSVESGDAKNNLEEEPVNELLEQIRRHLKEEWGSASASNSIEAARESEFEKLLKVYKDQGRPVEALANLLAAIESSKNEVEKLALFYKDIFYNARAKRAEMEKNKKQSFNFALDYIKLLNLPATDLKRFEKIMRGEK